jgi:hypothetical protein
MLLKHSPLQTKEEIMEVSQVTKIKDEIANLKDEIRNKYEPPMLELQTKMDKAYSLVAELEQILCGGVVATEPQPSIPTQTVTTDPTGDRNHYSTTARIISARDSLAGEFTTKQLLDVVNDDGNGEIPWTTFAPVFSQLLSRKKFVIVKPRHGKNPGLYKKPE